MQLSQYTTTKKLTMNTNTTMLNMRKKSKFEYTKLVFHVRFRYRRVKSNSTFYHYKTIWLVWICNILAITICFVNDFIQFWWDITTCVKKFVKINFEYNMIWLSTTISHLSLAIEFVSLFFLCCKMNAK